jgi:hypothetical protein
MSLPEMFTRIRDTATGIKHGTQISTSYIPPNLILEML